MRMGGRGGKNGGAEALHGLLGIVVFSFPFSLSLFSL